jgi:hypothetical protein
MTTIENTTTDTQPLTEEQALERYDEMLDDAYPMLTIGWSEFYPSAVLKELDPIAYRVGFHDFVDSLQEDGEKVEGYN